MFALTMLAALILDALIGWPAGLFRAIGHPVTWLGRLIGALDRHLNTGSNATRRWIMGWITLGVTLAAAVVPALLLQVLLGPSALAMIVLAILAWPLIAARSLHDHVKAVADPLARGDLPAARAAVANIVGRDVTELDEAGIARAAMESLAENASDGVIAPLFWGTLFGLPGIAAYKAVNTLDSMIGHRTERHGHFGWASAKLDDVLNFVPARLTGLLIALASPAPLRALAVLGRDGQRHRSPNAGYPEAAMAGGLGVRLAGPRVYHHVVADEPWLNGDAPDPGAADLKRALKVYGISMAFQGALLAALALYQPSLSLTH